MEKQWINRWKWKSPSRVWLCDPYRLEPIGLLCPWNSPGKNTGVGSHSLLQGIFPTQGWNPGLPHCRRTLPSEPPGKPELIGEGLTKGWVQQRVLLFLGPWLFIIKAHTWGTVFLSGGALGPGWKCVREVPFNSWSCCNFRAISVLAFWILFCFKVFTNSVKAVNLLRRVISSRGRGHMYTYGWLMWMYGRNQQNIVKQLSFKLK